jgi:VanZ family protein
LETTTQDKIQTSWGRAWAGVLSAIAVFLILCATLFPFNPFPKNRVFWLSDAHGLRFRWGGVVVSKGQLQLPKTGLTNSCTLELLVRPVTVEFSSTILAFYAPGRRHQFEVRQWNDGLLLTHNASIEHDSTHAIKIDVDHVFHAGKLAQVTISSGRGGTNVYVDGMAAGYFLGFKISPDDLNGEVILGTSLTDDSWPGELHGLAIYARELTPEVALSHYKEWSDPDKSPDLENAVARYTFTEGSGTEVYNQVPSGPTLDIPKFFYVPHKPFLQTPAQEFQLSWEYLGDITQNILGFVPLGLVVCAYFAWRNGRWQSVVCATVLCGALSMVVEVSQYFIPQRASGMTDIITNTLGATLGAMLARTRVIRRILEALHVMPSSSSSLEEAGIRQLR